MDYYHTSRQTLGDLPFIEASGFGQLSEANLGWRGRYVGKVLHLERVQHLLHEQSLKNDEDDEYPLEPGGYKDAMQWTVRPLHIDDQKTITVLSRYRPRCYQNIEDRQIVYHENILPRWEAFANAISERKNVEAIRIDNIVLPPSPYVEKQLLPALSNNTNLMSLQLSRGDLGSDDVKAVAKFIRRVSHWPNLIYLGARLMMYALLNL